MPLQCLLSWWFHPQQRCCNQDDAEHLRENWFSRCKQSAEARHYSWQPEWTFLEMGGGVRWTAAQNHSFAMPLRTCSSSQPMQYPSVSSSRSYARGSISAPSSWSNRTFFGGRLWRQPRWRNSMVSFITTTDTTQNKSLPTTWRTCIQKTTEMGTQVALSTFSQVKSEKAMQLAFNWVHAYMQKEDLIYYYYHIYNRLWDSDPNIVHHAVQLR